MQSKLEQDYERKTKIRKVNRQTTLREGGHTRLYDLHHAKHLKKTEALKEAVNRLRGSKRAKEEEPIERSPESDLVDIIEGSETEQIIERTNKNTPFAVSPINEMNEQFNTDDKREVGRAFQRLESLSPRSSNDFNARLE